MWRKILHIDDSAELDATQLGGALLASDAVAWRLDAISGEFLFSSQFNQVFSLSISPFANIAVLNAMLSEADQHVFSQIFNADLNDVSDAVRACDIKLMLDSGDQRFRFMGRLKLSSIRKFSHIKERIFEGIVVSSHHWLISPSTESISGFLAKLFTDSSIASLITDGKGVLLSVNHEFEKLFHIRERKMPVGIGRYNVLHDKNIHARPEVLELVRRVYHLAEIHSVDIAYQLTYLERSSSQDARAIHLRANLLPIKNRHGLIERVLIQLENFSFEKEALQVLLKQQRELQESADSYKAFIANSSEAIWCYDMVPPIPLSLSIEEQVDLMAQRSRLSQANKVLLSMFKYESLEAALGMGLPESGSTQYMLDLQYFVENNYRMVDHDIIRVDAKGRRFYFQISCVGIQSNNALTRVWGTTKDVTVRKRYEHRLEHVLLHDALTGLPNRANLYQEIESFFDRAENAVGALLLIDLDRFKEINDTLGHQVGDHLLKLIGPRISSIMTEFKGTIARLGGDEFAIFLPDIGYQQNAMKFAHKLLDALRLEFNLEVFCAEISASIGVVLVPLQASDVNTVMRYADVAMYHAKEQVSGIAVYQTEIDPHSPKRLAMMSELGRAIREDQLCLYFQPKVKLSSQSFYGVEALIRWNHPDMGFVPPNDFIPIAEVTSLIHPLTEWVLEKSIKQCCLWRSQGFELTVAVNLSTRNLLDESMPKLVYRLLQKYDLPAHVLELEITESAIMNDPIRALRVLQQLHELGVQLSIDDFGTGYSSLAYLKKLPVQTLKIDIFFIRHMLEDKQDELIVDSTIRLAHSLNLKVVAEGVENKALVNRLTAMGCDDAQGYFIGCPMPVAELDQWMQESSWISR